MCRIITVANQKGGVTKTTICQHLSYLLAEQGRRVLCVDFDPQINLTSTLLPDGQAVGMDISGVMACLLEDQDLPVPSSYIQRCGKASSPPPKALSIQSAVYTPYFASGTPKKEIERVIGEALALYFSQPREESA